MIRIVCLAPCFVLLLIGYEADMTLFHLAGAKLHENSQAPVFNEQTMETSVPGLYAAGTAVGGTQDRYVLFIENCHVHVSKILAAITGKTAPASVIAPEVLVRPES